MRTIRSRILVWHVLMCMAVASLCLAGNETAVATKLYAVTDNLYLDDNGMLRYSSFIDAREREVIGTPKRYLRMGGSASNLWQPNVEHHLGLAAFRLNYSQYHDLWFSFIEQYDLLAKTVGLLLNQFKDIARRLDILHTNRSALLSKYGQYRGEAFLEPIDNDIKYLSSLGIQLRDVSRRFFTAIKPRLIDAEIERDILKARTEGMRGLTTFERELAGVTTLPDEAIDKSLEQIVAAVDQAVRELEKAISE